MLNKVILIGRTTREVELRRTSNGTAVSTFTLAVDNRFVLKDGKSSTDFISCVLWKGVAESTAEYCKKGDLVGIKGRIQTRDVELEDETHKKYVEVIAEKVTFLSSKRQEEAE